CELHRARCLQITLQLGSYRRTLIHIVPASSHAPKILTPLSLYSVRNLVREDRPACSADKIHRAHFGACRAATRRSRRTHLAGAFAVSKRVEPFLHCPRGYLSPH